ncbi:MAG: hypothetical protein U0L09_10405 [Christensenellales bacterium]|nr:hypothetical protein [Christensenellales bacterium]
MSNSRNILAFEAALKENEALREQYEGALNRIAENKEASCDGEAMVKAAAEVGFTLSMPEAERLVAQNQAIDLEDLEMLAGGESEWCFANEFCHAAFCHDDDADTSGKPCWSNYLCFNDHHG